MKRSEVLKLRKIIESAVQSLPDETALQAVALHPEWASNVSYAVGFKAQRGGKLWRVLQEHTSQDGWQPENAASLWEQINEKHSGAMDDPIPYDGNMALESGKHYIQNNTIYLCIRDTVNPVYNPLADLIGIFVEEV